MVACFLSRWRWWRFATWRHMKTCWSVAFHKDRRKRSRSRSSRSCSRSRRRRWAWDFSLKTIPAQLHRETLASPCLAFTKKTDNHQVFGLNETKSLMQWNSCVDSTQAVRQLVQKAQMLSISCKNLLRLHRLHLYRMENTSARKKPKTLLCRSKKAACKMESPDSKWYNKIPEINSRWWTLVRQAKHTARIWNRDPSSGWIPPACHQHHIICIHLSYTILWYYVSRYICQH